MRERGLAGLGCGREKTSSKTGERSMSFAAARILETGAVAVEDASMMAREAVEGS